MRILHFTPMVVNLFFAGYGEASSIFLDLGVSEKRCIADSVQGGADTSFRYHVADGHSGGDVIVKVTDPLGRVSKGKPLTSEWDENVIDKKKYPRGGTYKVCFQNSRGQETRVELQYDLVSEDGKNEGMREDLEKVHGILKNSKQLLESLKGQMKETKNSEISDVHGDIELRFRINTGSCFTIVVVIAASAWQLILLNKFFRSKKLI